MGRRANREISAQLSRVSGRFAAWRAKRPFGTRIPDSLWAAAVKAAASCGVAKTSRALGVDYYGLRKRLQAKASKCVTEPFPMPAFLELPASTLAAPGECMIEFEKPEGCRMRVHLKGVNVPDVLALGAGFWSAE